MISIHDVTALEQLRSRWRLEPQLLRQLRNGFYKKHQSAAEVLDWLAKSSPADWASQLSFHALQLDSRHHSQVDGASKLIFRTARGPLIEAVILRIASGRTSLCISTQAGCAARCRFCATGHMNTSVNLSSAEILDQVIQANQMLASEDRAARNVVFMGMGEPFHNEAALFQAIEVLLAPACFDLSPRHVMVSTVGIPAAMVRCATRFPRVRLALSLHSARQEQREQLLPLARHHSLEQLHRALREVTSIQQQPIMIEYLLLDGWNDSERDMDELCDYLQGLSVHINLIPYNPIAEAPELRATPATRQRQCAAALKSAGFAVTIRHSLGTDIAAACGQLVRREHALSGDRQ